MGLNGNVGKKGKSGRKKAYEEFNKVKSVNLLWEKVRKKVEKGEELSEFEEKLCMSVLPKTIKEKREYSGELKVTPIYAGKSVDTIQKHDSNGEDISTNQEN